MAHILIGEDSHTIKNITRTILEQHGHTVKGVRTGKAVLELLAKESFDVLLLDLVMPETDGMTCAKRIREKESNGAMLPIIAVTGNSPNYKKEDFDAAGICEVVPKPVDYGLLLRTIDHCLSSNPTKN